MFGYVVANKENLNEERQEYYKACYCGLCRTLGRKFKGLGRLTLNYDMAFLILVLSSIYNNEKTEGEERCVAHPIKAHKYWQNKITEYAADMNIVLAYYNFLDDWEDDSKIISYGEAKFFENDYNKAEKKYPQKCSYIKNQLDELSNIERRGVMNPDIPGKIFGNILGEVFSYNKDEYEEDLRAFGNSLGEFIYIMDAVLDFKKDLKKERYNPLVGTPTKNFKDILNILMHETVENYKKLPIEQDKDIIENVLYLGVWTQFEIAKMKNKEKNNEGSL